MSAAAVDGARPSPLAALRRRLPAPIYLVLVLVLVAIGVASPGYFADASSLLFLLKLSVPLMLVTAGELFVLVGGEFDLSVGSLITLVVVVAAQLVNNDPARAWWVMLLVIGIGVLVGLLNGLITTRLRVPSFIATLGMLLIIDGAVTLWTTGAPRGALTANFRMWGRGSIAPVPVIGALPRDLVVLVVAGAVAILLLHRTTFGRQLTATGGNPRAAALSGVDVPAVRTLAFVLSGLFAAVAGILVGGLFPITAHPGRGYEFQAISAAVLGGAVLGGGKASMAAGMTGALTLQALFTLLNVVGLPNPLRAAVQGVLIVGAMAFAAYRLRRSVA